jgi:hypothetical protein
MESLAAVVAAIFLGLIAISLVNLVLAVLARRGKVKLWVGIVSNTITGIAAIFGINGAWALGTAPLISVLAGSIILTLPRNING